MINSSQSVNSTSSNPEKRIGSAMVRDLCGGISDMSLWRWLKNSRMAFPRPIYIGRRRYWKEVEIVDWLDQCDHRQQSDDKEEK